MDRPVFDLERIAKLFIDPLAERLGFELLDLVEQHDKLVTPVAGHDIVRAHRGTQQLRDPDEQLIAERVAQSVVDRLEAVEIDKQQADVLGDDRPCLGTDQVLLEPAGQLLPQHGAVGQPGQRIVQRGMLQTVVRRMQLPLPGAGASGEEQG
jgi:hypothetical protein